MNTILQFIYLKLPQVHSLLMRNKYYFWYRHICWNYGGVNALIDHQSQLGSYQRGEKGPWKI